MIKTEQQQQSIDHLFIITVVLTHTDKQTDRQTKALFYSTILIAARASSKFPALYEAERSCLFL
jgi:hypothetical protein